MRPLRRRAARASWPRGGRHCVPSVTAGFPGAAGSGLVDLIARRRPRWLHTAWCSATGALGLLLALAGTAGGQNRFTVLEEPSTTAVGVAVVVATGGAVEAESEAGATHLAAQALLEGIRSQLESLGGHASVECSRSTIRFTLLLPARTWRVATDLLLDQLFRRREVNDAALERARARVLRALRLDEGNPAHEARIALATARFGTDSHWARAPCGRAETVAQLGQEEIREAARKRFVPSRATAAVVGPVEAEAARDVLRRALGDSGPPRLPDGPRARPAAAPRFVEKKTITTWVGLAFPLPEEPDTEALELLACYLREATRPSPARPDVHAVEIDLERDGGGGALVVYLVTEPDQAGRRASELRSLVRRLARDELSETEFESLVRRCRGARLLALAAPEARARDAALQLCFDREYRPPAAEIDALAAERLRRAAASLPEPTVVTVGPSRAP